MVQKPTFTMVTPCSVCGTTQPGARTQCLRCHRIYCWKCQKMDGCACKAAATQAPKQVWVLFGEDGLAASVAEKRPYTWDPLHLRPSQRVVSYVLPTPVEPAKPKGVRAHVVSLVGTESYVSRLQDDTATGRAHARMEAQKYCGASDRIIIKKVFSRTRSNRGG